MHSITGREPRASTLDINQPKESQPEPEGPGTGYYLALTFGTLLSSQRADAQKPDPHGPRPWLDVQHYAGFQCSRIRALVRRTSRSARRRENITPSPRPLHRAPRVASVSRSSPRRQDRRGPSVHPGAGSGTSRALCLLGPTVAAGRSAAWTVSPTGRREPAFPAVPSPQRPRKLSMPTVRPGWPPTSRTARRTPGMNEARS
jgi:hypothetical protein